MTQLTDMTLEEIINHPQFISIEAVKDSGGMYVVTFESDKMLQKDDMLYYLTCDNREIPTKRYRFDIYLKRKF